MSVLTAFKRVLAAAPAIYFETDHCNGWPAWLARLAKARNRAR